MKSINKHDILRSWVERESIDLSILISMYDELTGQSSSGNTVIGLADKTVTAKIFDEVGTKVLEFLYDGVDNDAISVEETETESKVVLHFTKESYDDFNASPDAEKWFELELVYADDPTNLFKNVFPCVSKEGTEMHFWIKLLLNRVN